MAAGLGTLPSRAGGPTEYQVKAAFLYNFGKFVDWPSNAFAATNAPLVIGVFGENPFGDNLQSIVRGKNIGNHRVAVRRLRSLSELKRCQILFVSASEKQRLPDILRAVRGAGVLTVSDMDHFTEAGGMISLFMENREIRFQINNEAARAAGLKISSKLLILAERSHPAN
ncbi:MAG: YfiR family protein [Verrucomicrobiota bacterium]|nr:YfiR family protein [Verrucomicrobiota bacterium]